MNLRIHRLAVAEIDREVDYYESRQTGLGTGLEDEIEAAFSLILRSRCLHRRVRRTEGRRLLRRLAASQRTHGAPPCDG